jgi:hypothetical protein
MASQHKFTQKIKDLWLTALKSGDYTQGFHALVTHIGDKKQYCCIGVLGEVCSFLSNSEREENNDLCPYKFLHEAGINLQIASRQESTGLISINDSAESKQALKEGKPDYSLIIPLIEALVVKKD